MTGDGEGQGSLVCCSPWGHKESDMTEQRNSNNKQCQNLKKKIMTNHGINLPVEKEKILLVFGTEAHCKIPLLLWKKIK